MTSTPQGEPFHLVGWLVLRRGDEVLLARRHGVAYASGLWGLPGGHVEEGETFAQAAVREAREEVGVLVALDDAVPIGMSRYVDPPHRGLTVLVAADRWEGEPRPVSECDAVAWARLDDLPQPVLPWLPDLLRHVLVDGEWFDENV